MTKKEIYQAALKQLSQDLNCREEDLIGSGTSLSNLHSQNIAHKSGFYPAWVETEA